ncbi:MAG: hypothetical protein LBH75_04990 [Treponema sp.]|jgi:hypothetical protein|nr:hypothetical protein [Treponema sp.]
MKKTIGVSIKAFLATAILATLCLAACEVGVTDTEVYYADSVWTDFKGQWLFTGSWGTDGYTIGDTALSYDDGGDLGEYDSDFTADVVHYYKFVVFNVETSADSAATSVKDGSGVFIIKLSTGANAGKYTAVYFRNFNAAAKSMDMATAYFDQQFPYCFETEEAAVRGFASLAAMNKYVSTWGGPYTSQ